MSNIRIKNKKAGFQYFILDKYMAGIQLTGTEIKSIRSGKASLNEAYCAFQDEELFIINMHIAEYTYGTYNNHEPKRPRKLLLNKRELRKIKTKVQESGLTIIPLSLFINPKGLVKIDIATAKGKKLFDKRETIKKKDIQREMDRNR